MFVACVENGLLNRHWAIEPRPASERPWSLATANSYAIESLNSTLRKLLQYRGHFPTDEAVHKLLYLALSKMERKWERSIRDCSAVLGQFSVFFKDRIPA